MQDTMQRVKHTGFVREGFKKNAKYPHLWIREGFQKKRQTIHILWIRPQVDKKNSLM